MLRTVEMRAARRPRRKRAAARSFAAALGHLLLALAVLCGIARSGARYFYCEAFGLTLTDPCVRAQHDDVGRSGEALGERVHDCCEVVTLPAVPDGARTATPNIPSAPRVAVVAVGSSDFVRSRGGTSFCDPLLDRWRPPPRSPGENRAELMVFLA
jgi:hypothetical protein